jgi:hypothetical protein
MDQPQARDKDRPVEPAPQGEVDRRRAAQAQQMDELGGTPTTPSLPRPMFSGMVKGAAVGAIVGAILLTPLALVPILDLELVARLVIVWIAGAAAGATMGSVFFAGARSEGENPENQEYIYADGPDERRRGPGFTESD